MQNYIIQKIIEESHNTLPDYLYQYIDKQNPFVFCDFEVFAHDWLLCFSHDGLHIKSIINDINKLKKLFTTTFANKILVGYNGVGYDRHIMSALLNNIDPKIVNDKIIKQYDFNFNKEYGTQINVGNFINWYDPSTRLAGSLKTYEACEGENIYESDVSFDLDRQLTQEEIDETIKYCSFDVTQLIKYFYKENFETFLGHIGLIHQTLEKRKNLQFHQLIPSTDASIVGKLLCTNPYPNTTKPSDVIKLPDIIQLGKYKEDVEKFLKTPINTLKTGFYNDLNVWSLNVINKSILRFEDTTILDKLINKKNRLITKIKQLKSDNQKFLEKEKPTKLQQEKIELFPVTLKKLIDGLDLIKNEIDVEQQLLNELTELNEQLLEQDIGTSNYNYIVSKIIIKAKVTENEKLNILERYLWQTDDEINRFMYISDKKMTMYDKISIQYPFEIKLFIKGILHAFKTGGIHSVADDVMYFDKTKTPDKTMIIADVGSLYPNLMRIFNLCSLAIDNPEEFTQMIFDRIILKKQKDPFANILKLILNTTYGCMGAVFNLLYDPTNRLKVCIYGQALIVDLLDKLEDNIKSLEIYQSNTDGIVIVCDNEEIDNTYNVVKEWEDRTGLEMEYNIVTKLIQKDVSNYILATE